MTKSNQAFTGIISSLTLHNQHQGNQKITKKQLTDFEKEYIFLNLTDTKSFGKAFCQRFDILDYILQVETNYTNALKYIRKKYTK